MQHITLNYPLVSLTVKGDYREAAIQSHYTACVFYDAPNEITRIFVETSIPKDKEQEKEGIAQIIEYYKLLSIPVTDAVFSADGAQLFYLESNLN